MRTLVVVMVNRYRWVGQLNPRSANTSKETLAKSISGRLATTHRPITDQSSTMPTGTKHQRLSTARQAPIILVGCTKTKLDYPARAEWLYKGRIFEYSLAYARTIAPDSRIRVLSAQHGLVRIDRVIAPYDSTIVELTAAQRRTWGRKVAGQLARLSPSEIIVLAGTAYVTPWCSEVPAVVREPLQGLASGPRFAELCRLLTEINPPFHSFCSERP